MTEKRIQALEYKCLRLVEERDNACKALSESNKLLLDLEGAFARGRRELALTLLRGSQNVEAI